MRTRAVSELEAWLARAGVHQKDLAASISARVQRIVCQSTVSRILRGTMPRGDIMSALFAIAGIRVEWWSEADRCAEKRTKAKKAKASSSRAAAP